ncbi:acyl-CoA thioester hydrolase [Limimonas halophila]|uniref:Acyl-CoA thioester hydrolase n=1 Tax=Limimonas halophila TaxID=1082479 RepID=A0A1G7LZS4_9PROT|nr:YbgC/FadM family acyl-CoA thioesterase [Limimonas halophila]SDF54874.1 acyl-CoA thioester hydrolase [Limimonas halophila]
MTTPSAPGNNASGPGDAALSGRLENGAHRFWVRVYYEDTDAGGIVYHAAYLHFAERGRTEALRLCGFEQTELRERTGIILPVRAISLDYRRPCRLDELLEVRTTIAQRSRTSLRLHQAIGPSGEAEPRVAVDVRVVAVNAEGRPTRIPEVIAERLLTALPPAES